MDNEDIIVKKSLIVKIQELFTQFVTLFIKKEKVLAEATEELTEELREVNLKYEELLKDDSFNGLKETYNYYKVGVNPEGGIIAVEKKTGYVKTDDKFVCRVRFINVWRKSAYGNFDSKDEENCLSECFSQESESIYNKLKEIVEKQIKKTGNVDTKEIIEKMKDQEEKWARITIRRLFKSVQTAETITNYYRSLMKRPKKQTKPTESLSQALYGVDEYDA